MGNNNHSAFTTYFSGISNRLYNDAKVEANGEIFTTTKALWDTGATGTCISDAVVNTLNLKPISYTKMHTPSGESIKPMYLVDLILRNDVRVKDLKVLGSDIGDQGLDVLIGMDIICRGDFAVSNHNGKTVFSFRMPSQATTDYVAMIKSRIPHIKGNKPGRNDPCPCGSGKKYKQCCGKNK